MRDLLLGADRVHERRITSGNTRLDAREILPGDLDVLSITRIDAHSNIHPRHKPLVRVVLGVNADLPHAGAGVDQQADRALRPLAERRRMLRRRLRVQDERLLRDPIGVVFLSPAAENPIVTP